ncbi:MAG: homogentisate 1,2-dioxygenase [Gammaproteobacteria bacterium]|nr:homogentisate 1,2-dioxygenase [Gammaproteobacteria bacterium]
MKDKIQYMTGFANYFQSEAVDGALPLRQNSPQKVAYDLYAEQLSGSAFTAPRAQNHKSWLYRILPSVKHCSAFTTSESKLFLSSRFNTAVTPPDQFRWDPLPVPTVATSFVQGIVTVATNTGGAIHLYAANSSMQQDYFCNADGELLIVPQDGALLLKTEFGLLELKPTEIAVIQRGICFQVELLSRHARGYICENNGVPFMLPERGLIGANSLADERHFQVPTAWYEQRDGDFTLTTKFNGSLWQTKINHSPLDVVAWQGNYVPYKYDLTLFSPVNTVAFDHPDPSIFTVLTSPTMRPGTASIDFVIFPQRWMVAEDTFRPPYFHRNYMSEYMGLIQGKYDAKQSGFVPGGASLHNCMSGHGPDSAAFEVASSKQLVPEKYDETLAFMFESSQIWQVTDFALQTDLRQSDYLDCWRGLKARFKRP